MNGHDVLTLLGAIFAASGVSLVTGIMARPKTRAEANTAAVAGEVAISGDAREWARQFAAQAAAANTAAAAAEQRCDDLELQLGRLRRELASEREERVASERLLRTAAATEKTWSLFLEEFLREHQMPVPERPAPPVDLTDL